MRLKYIVAFLFAAITMSISAQGYKDGVEFYKAQRFTQARTLLERNLDKPGTDKAASYYYLGMIEMQVEKPDLAAAEKDFTNGIAANPKYPYNYVGKGLVDLQNGNSKEAEQQFKLAGKNAGKDASSVEVAIARAYYDVDADRFAKEIEKHMQKAYKKNAENPEYYLFLADQAADARKWGEANQNFELAYGYDPTAAESYVRYADILKIRNPKESIRVLQLLLNHNPQSALGQRELARTYYNNNMFREAVEQYGKYVNNPNHFDEDEAEYSFLLFWNKDYKKGYDYASQLLRQNPNNYSAMRFRFMNAAQLPELAAQMPAMAQELWAAHEADPKMRPFALIDYTLVSDQFSKAKEFDKAKTVLEEAINRHPKESRYRQALAYLYLNKEDNKAATAAYNDYMKMVENPSSGELRTAMILNYAMASQMKEENPEAFKQYSADLNSYIAKAKTLYPNDPATYFFMGREKILNAPVSAVSSIAIDDFNKGVSLFEQLPADKNKPYINNAITMYNYLAMAAAKAGNKQLATDYYNKILTLQPGNADATNGLKNLK